MDTENILDRLVRVGKVTTVDRDSRRVRVWFEDTATPSGWLCVLQHHGAGVYVEPDGEHTHSITDGSASTAPDHNHDGTHLAYWLPKVNEFVVVLYLPVFNGDGFVLGGI